jgi:hypothetical protein
MSGAEQSEFAPTSGEAADSGAASRTRLRRLDGILHGVFALVGVVIGVLVTAGITYLGDRSHRIADQRTASRLVSSEIRTDTGKLLYIYSARREGPAGPTTVAWNDQASTLARYSSQKTWDALARFYTQIAIILPSLSPKGVSKATWQYAKCDVLLGDEALKALGSPPAKLPPSYSSQGCRSAAA